MQKATNKASDFMTRSGSFATRGSRTGVDLLNIGAGEEEKLTLEQRRQALTLALSNLEKRVGILRSALKGNKISDKDREEITKKRARLIIDLANIKAEHDDVCRQLGRWRAGDLSRYIVSIFKARVTRPEWDLIVAEAYALRAKELENAEPDSTTQSIPTPSQQTPP